tara:strand:+ start:1483 stop:3903 length:2421 start_codon:yes stop_codon:yes gene_type:complete
MTVYYIDLNGGNDSNDGLSFANRKKTFDGLISENDKGSDNNDIAGNEYRIMGMPAVDTGVNATWTKGGWGNTDENGNTNDSKNIENATAATPIEITVNNHGYSTGDVIYIKNVQGIAGANGVWIVTVTGTNTFTLNNSVGTGTYSAANDKAIKCNHKTIKVNTGCKRIALSSGTSQTSSNSYNNSNNLYGVASSNVTVSRRSDFILNSHLRIQIANGFSTGKAWYYTLPDTLDLSAFQRISFIYHNQNDADISTAHLSLKLCTDTTGDVAAHSVQIAGFASRGGYPIVEDFGTNLNSAIKSVALYVDTDVGAEDIRLANIIAVKDANDGITHCDVIGKNTTAEPVWWQCQYIQEDLIVFGQPTSSSADSYNGLDASQLATYTNTSETVSLYKITPFNFYTNGQDYNLTDSNKLYMTPRWDGRLSSSEAKFLGGWDQTNMTTQNSVTWVNLNHRARSFFYNGTNSNAAHTVVERLGMCQGNDTVRCRGSFNTIRNIYAAGRTSFPPVQVDNNQRTRRGTVVDGIFQTMGNQHLVLINIQRGFVEDQAPIIIKNAHHYGGGTADISGVGACPVIFENLYLYSRQRFFHMTSIDAVSRIDIKNLFASGIRNFVVEGSIRVHNSSITNVINEVHPHTVNNQGTSVDGQISFRNYNGSNNDHRIYLANGMIKSETSVRHGTDGIAWKIQPTIEHTGNISFSALNNIDSNPLAFTVAKIFVEANKLVTFVAYLRRTNTGLTLRVAARRDKMGNYLSLASDAVANCTAAADTWQEVTLTFTPTDSAEITIDCEAFGGNSFTGYIDDISVSQAA